MQTGMIALCGVFLMAGCLSPPPPVRTPVAQPRPAVPRQLQPTPVSRPAARSAPRPAPVGLRCDDCRHWTEQCDACLSVEFQSGVGF